MKNLLIIALPAFFWAISDVLTRLSAGKIDAIIASWILAFGMLVTLGVAGILTIPNISQEISSMPIKHVIIMTISGILSAIGVFLYFQFLQQGGNFSEGMPLMSVFYVLFIITCGILFFKDPTSIKTILGIVFAGLSIYFLS